jgi:hypothetical protein
MQAGMISQDQRAFDSYVAFCGRVGTTPWGFEKWYRNTGGINPSVEKSHGDFHQPTGGNHASRGKQSLPGDGGWNGSWDNAVRLIEDAS